MKKLIEWVRAWKKRRRMDRMMRAIHKSDLFTVAEWNKAYEHVHDHETAAAEFTPAEKLIADDFGIAYPGDR